MKLRNTILLLLLALTFTSCANFGVPVNPKLQRQRDIEQCAHRFVDKGVKFMEASSECADRIYEEYER